jgi:alkylhydroperoxidase family enzyme
VAQLLGYVGGPGDPDDDVPAAQHEALTRWPTDPVFDRTERAVLALTEQFIIDVSGVSDEQRAALGECLPPEQIGAFVMGLYVCDYDLRHAMVLSRLFSGSDLVRAPVPPATSDAGEDAAACFNTFLRTVALMDRIDPVTTEVVRLKGARTHNCRICQSRRSAPAVDGGADESLFAKIGGPGERDLSLRLRTALGLAEAMVTQPASLSAPLADEIRRQFAASEVVELVYDIVRNSSQKAAVALAADAPVVEQGVEYFDIDQLGDVRAGLPTPLAVG